MSFAAAIPAILSALVSAGSSIASHKLEKGRQKKELKAAEKQRKFEKDIFKHPKKGIFDVGALTGHQKKTLNELLSGSARRQFDLSKQPSFKQGQEYLGNLLSNKPGAFEAFEAPIKKQFYEEEVPQLAERFTKHDAQRSSAFNQAFARAGEDLSVKLAALRSGLQMQALPQALQFGLAPTQTALQGAQLGLGTQAFQTLNRSHPNPLPVRGPGTLEKTLGGLAGGASTGLGSYAGNILGQSIFGKGSSGIPGGSYYGNYYGTGSSYEANPWAGNIWLGNQ